MEDGSEEEAEDGDDEEEEEDWEEEEDDEDEEARQIVPIPEALRAKRSSCVSYTYSRHCILVIRMSYVDCGRPA